MTGTLQTKGNYYYAVLNIYVDGKRKTKWISTGLQIKGNKRKAEAFLQQKIAEYDRKLNCPASDIIFADYIEKWLEAVAIKVDEVSLQHYTVTAKTHVIPYFREKGTFLCDVDCKILQEYINEKFNNGRKDGTGGLSPKTLLHHKNVLQGTLKEAIKNELIQTNPFERVTMPKQVKRIPTFYNKQQLQTLLTAISDERLYPLIYITVRFGLRRSELLGLKWDSFNFDEMTMVIKHTVSKCTKTVEKDRTKNASSYRTFPIDETVKNLIIQQKNNERENQKSFGKRYQKNDYVFKWEDGKPYSPDYYSHAFNKLLKKYALPHIRLHDLRHTTASLLINDGFQASDIQTYLGHANVSTTIDVYAHLEFRRKQEISDAMSKIVSTEKC